MRELSVIIPVYNEEESIKQVIDDLINVLKKTGITYEIIVVDDGSTDRTRSICAGLGVKLAGHAQNAGYGQAIKTGLTLAAYETVAIIDADGSYNPKDLPQLLACSQEYSMVVGARQNMHLRDSFLQFLARKMYLRLVSYVTGIRVPDANSGLRIFKKAAVMPYYPRLCRGFSFTTTLTLAMICDGRFVKFVPVSYSKRKGRSKVRWIKDTLGTAQILMQEVMYYNPIKAILPFSALCLLLGLINGIIYFSNGRAYFYITAALMSAAAVFFFILGLIADLISQGIRKK